MKNYVDFTNTDTSFPILIEIYAFRILQFYFFNNYFNIILSFTLVLARFGVPSCLPTKMCIPHKNKETFQIQENKTFCDKLILHLEVLGLNLGRKLYPDFVFVQC
jgi:hypothetical protein